MADAHSCKLSERQIGDDELALQDEYQRVGLLALVGDDIAVADGFENAGLCDPLHVDVAEQSKHVENFSHRASSASLGRLWNP